jgi:hypothetical protein
VSRGCDLLPTQVSPPWTLFDNATPEDPVLSGGVLTLSTSENQEGMYYTQGPPTIDLSGATTIEAGVRFVSGTTGASPQISTGTGIFMHEGTISNILYIGQDVVFLLASPTTRGNEALVDTDGAPHTYRIEIAANGSISVFYDGGATAILTGSMHPRTTAEEIAWGDGTSDAFGTSEWTFFRHDADAATAVAFRSLSASRTSKGVLVRWRTASEIDTLGFNVYREANGRRVKLNRGLIAARGRGLYSYLDRSAPRARPTRHWIQVVNLDGSRSWHGPAKAEVGR